LYIAENRTETHTQNTWAKCRAS